MPVLIRLRTIFFHTVFCTLVCRTCNEQQFHVFVVLPVIEPSLECCSPRQTSDFSSAYLPVSERNEARSTNRFELGSPLEEVHPMH